MATRAKMMGMRMEMKKRGLLEDIVDWSHGLDGESVNNGLERTSGIVLDEAHEGQGGAR